MVVGLVTVTIKLCDEGLRSESFALNAAFFSLRIGLTFEAYRRQHPLARAPGNAPPELDGLKPRGGTRSRRPKKD